MVRNTTSSWGSVARLFHWVLGFTILGMLAFGWWMNHIPARPDRFFYRSIHADIGYVVLLFTVLRLIWRGFNPTPALPRSEEHTSELQSPCNLVCRLLLEKKKKIKNITPFYKKKQQQ